MIRESPDDFARKKYITWSCLWARCRIEDVSSALPFSYRSAMSWIGVLPRGPSFLSPATSIYQEKHVVFLTNKKTNALLHLSMHTKVPGMYFCPPKVRRSTSTSPLDSSQWLASHSKRKGETHRHEHKPLSQAPKTVHNENVTSNMVRSSRLEEQKTTVKNAICRRSQGHPDKNLNLLRYCRYR